MVDPRATWNQYQPEERRLVALVAALVLICLGLGIVLGFKLLSPAQTEPPPGYIAPPQAASQTTKQSIAATFAATYRPGLGDSPAWFGAPRNGERIFSSRQAIHYFTAEQLKTIRSGKPVVAQKSLTWSKANSGALAANGSLAGRSINTPLGPAAVEATRALLTSGRYLLVVTVSPDPGSQDRPQPNLVSALQQLVRR